MTDFAEGLLVLGLVALAVSHGPFVVYASIYAAIQIFKGR